MRALVLAACLAGCTSSTSATVYLPGAAWSLTNPGGKSVPVRQVGSDYEAGPVRPGAVMTYSASSDCPIDPTNGSSTVNIEVDGVQPGDDYRGRPALPGDCEMVTPTLVVDGDETTWQVADPSAVDARMIELSSVPLPLPQQRFGSLTIDGRQNASLPFVARPQADGLALTVQLVECPRDTYDEIRPALVAASWYPE